jgi:hypothetical protein
MNRNITILTASIVTGVFMLINTAFAGDSDAMFTFGESGQTVSFEMSNEEIVVENKKLLATSVVPMSSYHQPKKWVDTIELAESGVTFEFTLTKEDIELTKAKAAKGAHLVAAYKKNEKTIPTDNYELAESGIQIRFVVSEASPKSKMILAEK